MNTRMKALSAEEELAVHREYPALLPHLLERGLRIEDAVAVAHNAVFLFYALVCTPPPREPGELLERFSLGQIARLCERYEERRESLEQAACKAQRRKKRELSG